MKISVRKIKNALISVYYKDGLEPIIKKLNELGVNLYSTGGTQKFIEDLGISVTAIEDITAYPSILGGRVKTLHPKVFGGILQRRGHEEDEKQVVEYDIPSFDLVIVNLYPFEETVASTSVESDIIEKIDIGGISLIRAAAKNFKDVVIIADPSQYEQLLESLNTSGDKTDLSLRKDFARWAFHISSAYDTAIFDYFNDDNQVDVFKKNISESVVLRYGENPHQKGTFYGDLNSLFDQLNGKPISYNNLLDIDAAINLIKEFEETTIAILKHNNACGIASDKSLVQAWSKALAGDPVSAFGGVIISNKTIDKETAIEINKLFYEIIIAPDYSQEAIELLSAKKKRIILKQKEVVLPDSQFRSLLNGVVSQSKDLKKDLKTEIISVTEKKPTEKEIQDLLFANILVKHTKSNAIIFVKNKQLLGGGTGQTSRVDATRQAIEKAKAMGFNLDGAVMSSDAFFPFPDCVELAKEAGIKAVIQPGGSINDKASIEYCNNNGLSMITTGTRHFKH